jgi:hypothetical protein
MLVNKLFSNNVALLCFGLQLVAAVVLNILVLAQPSDWIRIVVVAIVSAFPWLVYWSAKQNFSALYYEAVAQELRGLREFVAQSLQEVRNNRNDHD